MSKILALLCLAAVAGLAAAAQPAHASLNAHVLAQLNVTRSAHGLAPLRPSPRLAAAAGGPFSQVVAAGGFSDKPLRSSEMGAAGYFSHSSFYGLELWRRILRYGGPGAGAENLLWS